MHISRLAPDTWPDAMQSFGATPTGSHTIPFIEGAPPLSSRLSTGLELVLLVTMSGLVSLLLSIVAAGAI